jgi:hypothetical protein
MCLALTAASSTGAKTVMHPNAFMANNVAIANPTALPKTCTYTQHTCVCVCVPWAAVAAVAVGGSGSGCGENNDSRNEDRGWGGGGSAASAAGEVALALMNVMVDTMNETLESIHMKLQNENNKSSDEEEKKHLHSHFNTCPRQQLTWPPLALSSSGVFGMGALTTVIRGGLADVVALAANSRFTAMRCASATVW